MRKLIPSVQIITDSFRAAVLARRDPSHPLTALLSKSRFLRVHSRAHRLSGSRPVSCSGRWDPKPRKRPRSSIADSNFLLFSSPHAKHSISALTFDHKEFASLGRQIDAVVLADEYRQSDMPLGSLSVPSSIFWHPD